MNARRARQLKQHCFNYGFPCMFSTNCSNLITQQRCKTCPADICAEEYKLYRQHMGYPYLAVRGENEYHVPMKIKTYPVGHVPTHR